jgi:malonyl-CoA O-methyltransferase
MEPIERKRVQASFQRGASDYDQHTPVQQRVLQKLLSPVEQYLVGSSARVLDIGCGTGRLLEQLGRSHPDAVLTGLDLAPNMLRQAAERLPSAVTLVQGDAEHLPFSAESFSLVLSSSTFQWLDQLNPCFEDVLRVLKPGGSFIFSLFGGKTLFELRESWQQALVNCSREGGGQRDGTHRFHTCDQVQQALASAGFQRCKIWSELEVLWYPDVPHLLQAIKRIGAGTAKPPAGGGLGWRRILHEMSRVYTERFGGEGEVPVSYEVIYAEGSR